MASPQKEHGFTPIAHEILEALARQDITRRAWRILMLMFRESYGRQRKQFALSLREISQRTGIAKPHCSVALKELAVTNMVTASRVTGNGNHPKNSYIFQKDYHQWVVTKTVTVTRMVTEGLPNPVTPPTPPYKDIERKDNTATVTNSGNYERPKDPIGQLVMAYKLVKGFREDDRAWDKRHWARFSPSAKKLLEVFEGDIEKAATCLKSIAERFNNDGLTWVLDTVVRHADEWKLREEVGPAKKKTGIPSWQYQ